MQHHEPRVIHQGDLYWVQMSATDIPHPHVVVQDDVFNHSRIPTTIVCALTTNLGRVSLPGNVLLDAGEGGLPKPSVVEASKISTIEKAALGAYIGTLDAARVAQIIAGLRFLNRAFIPNR